MVLDVSYSRVLGQLVLTKTDPFFITIHAYFATEKHTTIFNCMFVIYMILLAYLDDILTS